MKYCAETGINRLGYDLLRNGYPALAEDVFQLNVTLHPDDGSWYDSWADALSALGRTDDAIALYRRALELRPDAKDTADKLKSLEEIRGPVSLKWVPRSRLWTQLSCG
ncbi:tetratricopeptide repeat protein [Sphingomonas sp.]|uniref:tetratricopeptide repeat protein n=1 Tax=Sphingomonas sp. TaxID=28214 RepID=UPI001EB9D205|nr:tetratricopeptide repeat protein [Sphingomonas sp.]MBX3594137.1 tetratricopeptide repeat protein [Sphingomonas sp.]